VSIRTKISPSRRIMSASFRESRRKERK